MPIISDLTVMVWTPERRIHTLVGKASPGDSEPVPPTLECFSHPPKRWSDWLPEITKQAVLNTSCLFAFRKTLEVAMGHNPHSQSILEVNYWIILRDTNLVISHILDFLWQGGCTQDDKQGNFLSRESSSACAVLGVYLWPVSTWWMFLLPVRVDSKMNQN